jgi:poly(A) polymerase
MTIQEAFDTVTTDLTGDAALRILERPEHGLSRSKVSSAALKVLYRLHRAGYTAYLVGGGVRDILLGTAPKDFDVVSNARPQEIRRLFRNSRTIGRRFRLVHVLFRGEVVEVATFRASREAEEGPDEWQEAAEEAAEEAGEEAAEEASGPRRRRLPPLDDSAFGTPSEDARRRDFTVNALFYDIATFSILDYVGGIDDLDARLIRTIGDPVERFEEDPVRMLRALEYSVRLDFRLEPATRAAVDSCADLIVDASPARLTYELQEGLRSGAAAGICQAWEASGLLRRAFPDLPRPTAEVRGLLEVLDRWVVAGRPVADAVVLAPFFLPDAVRRLLEMATDGTKFDNPAFLAFLKDLLDPSGAEMHLSNHTEHLLHHALFALSKLRRAPDRGRQVTKLARQDYFPVAWDVYEMAVEGGLLPDEPRKAWAKAIERLKRGETDDPGEGGGARRRRRRRRPRRRRDG